MNTQTDHQTDKKNAKMTSRHMAHLQLAKNYSKKGRKSWVAAHSVTLSSIIQT